MFTNFFLEVELIHPNAKLPTRANFDDAGMDVYTPIPVKIAPNSDVLIPLGWKCRFPQGFALTFWEKSGVATKKKLDLGACVVDAGYRGEVHCHLFNNSDVEVTFEVGDKLSQFLIFPVWHGKAIEVKDITNNTSRGTGGFGSTGEK